MPLSLRQIALAAATGSIALGAFGLGWWGSDDGARRLFTDTAVAGWQSPKPIISDASAFAKVLAQKPPFGAPAGQAHAAPPASQTAPANPAASWRVGGIVTTETSQYLIVLVRRPGENTARTEILRPGEELPDGSVVRTVEPTNVTIDRQGTVVRINMFAQN